MDVFLNRCNKTIKKLAVGLGVACNYHQDTNINLLLIPIFDVYFLIPGIVLLFLPLSWAHYPVALWKSHREDIYIHIQNFARKFLGK